MTNIFKRLSENTSSTDPFSAIEEAATFTYDPALTAKADSDPDESGKANEGDWSKHIHSMTPEELEAQRIAAETPDYVPPSGSNHRVKHGTDAFDHAFSLGDNDLAQYSTDSGRDVYDLVSPSNYAIEFDTDASDYIHDRSMDDPDYILSGEKTYNPPVDDKSHYTKSVALHKLVAEEFNNKLLSPEELADAAEILFHTGSGVGVNLHLWNALKDMSKTVQAMKADGSYSPELIAKMSTTQLELQKEFIRAKLYPERVTEGKYPDEFISNSPSDVQSVLRTFNNIVDSFHAMEDHIIKSFGSVSTATNSKNKIALAKAMLPELNNLLVQINRVKFSSSSDAHNIGAN